MRILLVTQPTDGGVYRHVADLATGLVRRGHDVVLAAPPAHIPGGLPCEVVPVQLVRELSVTKDVRAVTTLARAVRHVRPDVVHVHSSKAGALGRVARLATPTVPLVYTPHGYSFAAHFPRWEQRAYLVAERLLAPLTTRTLCVCEAERRLAQVAGCGHRARVVYNGVEPSDFSVPPPKRQSGPSVATLAMFRPGKGVETLLDAMPAVCESVPQVRLNLVGSGPCESQLRARAHSLGVEDVVRFVPPPQEPMDAVRDADVFVHPSWAESFPYTVLDAMTAGLAVVATDVGGVGEVIDSGVNGVLVPPKDPARIARAVVSLLGAPAHAAALAERARLTAKRFDIDAMVDGVLAVYEGAVDARPRLQKSRKVIPSTKERGPHGA